MSILEYLAAIQQSTDVSSIKPCRAAQAELTSLETARHLTKMAGHAQPTQRKIIGCAAMCGPKVL